MMTPWQVQDDPLSRRLAALREWAAMSTKLNFEASACDNYHACVLVIGLAYIDDTITVN